MAKAKKYRPVFTTITHVVPRSELFRGCAELWQAFIDAEPDLTWGDDNIAHTLVEASVLLDQLAAHIEGEVEEIKALIELKQGENVSDVEYELVTVHDRLTDLPTNAYIDMEQ